MRETRLSGSEGGAGSIPVPTPIVAWAFQPMSGRPRIAGRTAEGWPTEHTEHTEGFLTGGNGVIGGRRAEDGERMADGGRRTADDGRRTTDFSL